MENSGVRPSIAVAVVAWLAVLSAVVIAFEWRSDSPATPSTQMEAPAEAETAAAAAAVKKDLPPLGTRTPGSPATEEVPYIEGLVWGDIDLREAMAVMPDNLYWQQGSPTKDPAVLEARELEKKRRNEEYGRVLAGDADEEEVRAYYDYRTRLSTDYLEMAKWMRNRFAETGSDELLGMLDLSVRLHTARLARISSELEEALEHSRAQEKAREQWRRDQEEFGGAAARVGDEEGEEP